MIEHELQNVIDFFLETNSLSIEFFIWNKPTENKLNTTNYKIINYHQLLPATLYDVKGSK